MSLKLSATIILLMLAILLTHLFDTNITARTFIAELGSKIGINIGNYVTATPVCPQHYTCTTD